MPTPVAALDFGSSHIRGIEAVPVKNGGFNITRTYELDMPEATIEAGTITSPGTLKETFRKFWKESRFTAKKVYLLASGNAFEFQELRRQIWSPPKDFKALLPHYLGEDPNFKSDEWYVDSHTIREYYAEQADNDTKYKDVLAILVDKGTADQYIELFESQNLLPASIDILPFSLIRAFNAVEGEAAAGHTVMSIDIGADTVTTVIHKDQQPLYLNSAPHLGGRKMTGEIASNLAIDHRVAEMLKKAVSVPEADRARLKVSIPGSGGATDFRYSDFSQNHISQVSSIISQEITNIIEYIDEVITDATTRVEQPAKLSISGGAAYTVNLLTRIQNETGYHVGPLNVFGGHEKQKAVSEEVAAEGFAYASVYGLLAGRAL